MCFNRIWNNKLSGVDFFYFPISTEKQKIKIYSIGWCFPNWNFLWNWSTNRMIHNWTTEETVQSARFKRITERHWQQRQGHFSSLFLAYYSNTEALSYFCLMYRDSYKWAIIKFLKSLNIGSVTVSFSSFLVYVIFQHLAQPVVWNRLL